MDAFFSSILLFIFGSGVGSFFNVVSMRYDPERSLFSKRSIGGRSRCSSCARTLRWYELMPLLSFALQLGRCRSCRTRLSLQYPIVELATGLIFVFLPQAVGAAYQIVFARVGGAYPLWYWTVLVIYYAVAAALVLIAVIDYRLRIIPDALNVFIAVCGAALGLIIFSKGLLGIAVPSFLGHYAALFGFRSHIAVNLLVAVLFGAVFFGLFFFLSRGRAMGFGDVKLAGALGVFLGWPDALFAIAFSFIIGAFWSIMLMLAQKKSLKSLVPFGPFIVLGVFVVMFFGRQITDFYFRLFP